MTKDAKSRVAKLIGDKMPLKDEHSPASTVAADTARYEALAREHGADLSEEGFNEALKKVGIKPTGH